MAITATHREPPSAGANLSRRISFSLVARSVDLSLVDMRDHSSELPELWDIDRLVAYLGTSQHLVYCLPTASQGTSGCQADT